MRSTRWLCVALATAVLLIGLGGCASVQFYAQAALGQATLMLARRDTDTVLADPATAPAVAAKLRLITRLLRFAEVELDLPVGDRYGSFVDSDAVLLWNVVAAPEFDVTAIPRCYPVVGCAVYRGYFSREAAEREAARLGVDHDVHIAPVAAYSTLGWFNDPILGSFLHYDEANLAELIFHELAHSVVYVKGDSVFNESFATFVGIQGAMAWLEHTGGDAGPYVAGLAAENSYRDFLGRWREHLATLYRRPIADDAKRQLKAAAFAAMRACYGRHRTRLGNGRYDTAMARPYNNARLALVAAYDDLRPAFERLYTDLGDWPAFYAEVKRLAGLRPRKNPPRSLRVGECDLTVKPNRGHANQRGSARQEPAKVLTGRRMQPDCEAEPRSRKPASAPKGERHAALAEASRLQDAAPTGVICDADGGSSMALTWSTLKWRNR